jgi:hypothetical protein
VSLGHGEPPRRCHVPHDYAAAGRGRKPPAPGCRWCLIHARASRARRPDGKLGQALRLFSDTVAGWHRKRHLTHGLPGGLTGAAAAAPAVRQQPLWKACWSSPLCLSRKSWRCWCFLIACAPCSLGWRTWARDLPAQRKPPAVGVSASGSAQRAPARAGGSRVRGRSADRVSPFAKRPRTRSPPRSPPRDPRAGPAGGPQSSDALCLR